MAPWAHIDVLTLAKSSPLLPATIQGDDFMLSHAVTAGMPSFAGAFKLPQDDVRISKADHRQHRPTLTDNFPLAIITSQSQENCPSKQSISSASEGSAVQH
ncbi:hypothetical protein NQZ68_031006 [Dissostichus eleginoides]|nr:hypothetical protein NQZ68_031006 [Dissostichus eleginoides]